MLKKYYVAYGSNLNLNQMNFRCRGAKPIGSMTLNGYRLVYKGSADSFSYLTIEESEGYQVPLGLFEVSSLDISSLDKYEGYPNFYSKFYIPVEIGEKKEKAMIYIMNKDFDYHFPSRKYVETCEEGYDDFGFDRKILDRAYMDTVDSKSQKLKKTYPKYPKDGRN